MKHLLYPLLLGLLATLQTGCHNTPPALLRAETLMRETPDSALRLLETIPCSSLTSDRDEALYALLVTQARCQLHMDLTHDTLSYIALEYYRNTRDSARAYKAYFYAGQVARAMHKPELAMTYYLRANAFLQTSRNFSQHYVSNTWLSMLNGEQALYPQQVHYAQRALTYADSLDDDNFRCISLGDISSGYLEMQQYDSALLYSRRALALAQRSRLDANLAPIYSRLSDICTRTGRYPEAMEYRDRAITALPPDDWVRGSHYIAKADIFNRLGRYDSALYYLRRPLATSIPNLSDQASRLKCMADAYQGVGRIDSALSCLRRHNALQDSLNTLTHTSEIYATQRIFRYDQLKEENAALNRQRADQQNWLYRLSLSIILLVLLGGGILFLIYRHSKLRIISQQRQLLRQQKHLRKTIQEKLQTEATLAEMHQKEEQLKTAFFKQLSMPLIPTNDSERATRLTDRDWQIILDHADAIFNGFTRRLREQYPQLNRDDIRYCCMVKMQLSHSEIARIVCLEKDSVKKRLKRIRLEKMNADSGTTLENLLRNF